MLHPNGGTPAFKKAVAEYYENRFEVSLDPQSEVIGLIGSKEGLFNLSQVLLNPGDVSLVPDPGYPVYSASGLIAGGEIHYFPLVAENGFLPDLNAIPEDVLSRAKILWLNYPNNPTGAVASMSFFEQAVNFAKKHKDPRFYASELLRKLEIIDPAEPAGLRIVLPRDPEEIPRVKVPETYAPELFLYALWHLRRIPHLLIRWYDYIPLLRHSYSPLKHLF